MDSQFQQISEFVALKKNDGIQQISSDAFYKKQALDSVQSRNELYGSFLTEYIHHYDSKAKTAKRMKWIFFAVIMLLLVGMVAVCILTFVNVSKKSELNYSDVGTVVTSVGGVIASFIVLPKVIAENLFPAQEEDRTAEIFDSMIKYDMELEKFYADQGQPKEKQDDESGKDQKPQGPSNT